MDDAEIRDYYTKIDAFLKTVMQKNNLDTIHDALLFWYGENFLKNDTDDLKERIVPDGSAEGIDAILIDKTKPTIYFLQGKVVADVDKVFDDFEENKIKLTLMGAELLLKGNYKGKITPDLENFVDEYHELNKYGNYETILLFLAMKKPPQSDKFIQEFLNNNRLIKIQFFDFEKIINLYNTYLHQKAQPPELISFEIINESPRNVLDKNAPIKARIFTIKGSQLASNYDSHRERLFQENLRYNLGLEEDSINQQIYKTAIDKDKSSNFWYFNNGVTIVCKEIKEVPNGKIIHLIKPQIINGAQTTYSLHEAFIQGKLLDSVEVILRVMETNDPGLMDAITLYSNSQNALNLRDMASNDSVQLSMQKQMMEGYNYFYEKKRGEFDTLYPTPKAKRDLLGDNYWDRRIDNVNTGQAFLALYLDSPANAKSQKNNIFVKNDQGFYSDVFNEKRPHLAESLLMSWKLLKYIESQEKDYRKQYKTAESKGQEEKEEIYKYDFILHSKYFILNIFKYYLLNKKLNLENLTDILKIIQQIDTKDQFIMRVTMR